MEHITELGAKKVLLLILSLAVLIFFSNVYISQSRKGKTPITFGLSLGEITAEATETEETQDHAEQPSVDNKETSDTTTEAATSHEEEESKAASYAIWQDFCAFFLAILLITGAYAIIKRKAVQQPKK